MYGWQETYNPLLLPTAQVGAIVSRGRLVAAGELLHVVGEQTRVDHRLVPVLIVRVVAGNVCPDGHVFQPGRLVAVGDLVPLDVDVAVGEVRLANDGPQKRGFAAASAPQDHGKLAARDGHVDALEERLPACRGRHGRVDKHDGRGCLRRPQLQRGLVDGRDGVVRGVLFGRVAVGEDEVVDAAAAVLSLLEQEVRLDALEAAQRRDEDGVAQHGARHGQRRDDDNGERCKGLRGLEAAGEGCPEDRRSHDDGWRDLVA